MSRDPVNPEALSKLTPEQRQQLSDLQKDIRRVVQEEMDAGQTSNTSTSEAIHPRKKRRFRPRRTIGLSLIIGVPLICLVILVHSYLQSIYEANYDDYYSRQYDKFIEDAAQAGTLKLKVYIDVTQIEYEHLGTDISITHSCNGSKIESGDAIYAADTIKMTTEIIERDSIDDVGKRTTSFDLPPYENSYTKKITVREDGGTKYKDAYATWEVTYSFEPIVSDMEPVTFWDVIQYGLGRG